jgi:hypothetical protein
VRHDWPTVAPSRPWWVDLPSHPQRVDPPPPSWIDDRRSAAGVGYALAGHLPVSGPALAAVAVSAALGGPYGVIGEGVFLGVLVAASLLAMQAALAATRLIAGGVAIARGDRGFGFGLILGWLGGVLLAGLACCVAAAVVSPGG